MCDPVRKVPNAKLTLKSDNLREGKYVDGTTYEVICDENFVQNHTESVCGVDGKYAPLIECVPSKWLVH